MNRPCAYCGEPVIVPSGAFGIFCSDICYGADPRSFTDTPGPPWPIPLRGWRRDPERKGVWVKLEAVLGEEEAMERLEIREALLAYKAERGGEREGQ